MAYIISDIERYKLSQLQFEFTNLATLNASERATLYINGIAGNEWIPTYQGVWQGQVPFKLKSVANVTAVKI